MSLDLAATDTGGDVGLFGAEARVDWRPPPDDSIPSPTVFEVSFGVDLPGVGIAQHTAHFEVTPGQPLRFANVNVGAPQSPAFPVSFDLLATGSVDTGEPLFAMTLSGAFSEEQAVPTLAPRMLAVFAALLVGAAVGVLRRRVQPRSGRGERVAHPPHGAISCRRGK